MAYNYKYSRPAVHAFADKYIKFFEEEFGLSRESYSRLFGNLEFPNECRNLSFDMDCGHSFTEAFGSEAWLQSEGLKRVIDNANDLNIIGAGIFSKWRYYNHWSCSDPTEDDKEWFLILLQRMKQLSIKL